VQRVTESKFAAATLLKKEGKAVELTIIKKEWALLAVEQ
jgi:hypothetical protein